MTDDKVFAKSTLGAGAVIFHREHVLLVQMNYGIFAGHWILPGGWVSEGEHPDQAAIREVKEETGLTARAVELVAIRHRLQPDDLPNVYWVFRAELLAPPLDGMPEVCWPPAELQCVRFWPVAEALTSEVIRPQTRLYIRMATEVGGLLAYRGQKLSKFDDTVFGLQKFGQP